MHRRAAVSLIILGLAGASCAGGSAPSVSPEASLAAPAAPIRALPVPSATRVPAALDGQPLVSCRLGSTDAFCGSLSVPENPSDRFGRRIDLRVAVIPATAAAPEPDPVFMLAGGPGGAATESMAWTAVTYRGIHATRDIVLVDQRGTGGSNVYWIDGAPDVTGLTAPEADAAMEAWVADEMVRFGGDPRFYTTSVAMDDLDVVRAALGYDQINLYGGSYGATAAQYYIRQHAEHLRAVVLDGATLTDVPIFELIAPASQRALHLLFDRCSADASCAEAFPDLPSDFDRAMRLVSDPITTEVPNPATGEPLVIDLLTFTAAVHGALLTAETAAALPSLIHAAADGRWEVVANAILGASGGRPPETGYQLMSAIIRCAEPWARYDPAEVARFGSDSYYLEFQLEMARQQAAGCRYAPPGRLAANEAAPVRTDVPVLFLVGEGDPQDPPSNIAAAPERFPNSLTIVAAGHGHTVAHLGCLPSIVDAFVAAGTVEGLDTSCVAGGVPLPPFRVP